MTGYAATRNQQRGRSTERRQHQHQPPRVPGGLKGGRVSSWELPPIHFPSFHLDSLRNPALADSAAFGTQEFLSARSPHKIVKGLDPRTYQVSARRNKSTSSKPRTTTPLRPKMGNPLKPMSEVPQMPMGEIEPMQATFSPTPPSRARTPGPSGRSPSPYTLTNYSRPSTAASSAQSTQTSGTSKSTSSALNNNGRTRDPPPQLSSLSNLQRGPQGPPQSSQPGSSYPQRPPPSHQPGRSRALTPGIVTEQPRQQSHPGLNYATEQQWKDWEYTQAKGRMGTERREWEQGRGKGPGDQGTGYGYRQQRPATAQKQQQQQARAQTQPGFSPEEQAELQDKAQKRGYGTLIDSNTGKPISGRDGRPVAFGPDRKPMFTKKGDPLVVDEYGKLDIASLGKYKKEPSGPTTTDLVANDMCCDCAMMACFVGCLEACG